MMIVSLIWLYQSCSIIKPDLQWQGCPLRSIYLQDWPSWPTALLVIHSATLPGIKACGRLS